MNEQPTEQAAPAAEEKPRGTIEITDGHVLKVTVDLNQGNGIIVGYGMLEMAKGAIQSWAVARKMHEEKTRLVKPSFTRTVIDKLRSV